MPALESGVTPIDRITGIPLPIYPEADRPPVPPPRQKNSERAGDRHHPEHPRLLLASYNDLGHDALRHSRIEWVDYDTHHNKYHPNFNGPPLPKTEEQLFKTVVFAAALYVPDRAIAFGRNDEPKLRFLPEDKRSQLVRSGAIRMDDNGRDKVKGFLLDYAIRQGFPFVDEKLIEEFISTNDIEKSKQIGRQLILLASDVATDSFSRDYQEAKRSRLLPLERSNRVANFVCNLVTVRSFGGRRPAEIDKRVIDTTKNYIKQTLATA